MSLFSRRTGLFVLGAATAAAATSLALRVATTRGRRDLFSPSPLRRLAALQYLNRAAATVEAVTVLRDFRAWEPRRLLRNRATVILARMVHELSRPAELP